MAITKRSAITKEGNPTPNPTPKAAEKKSVFNEATKHIMTGISNMIPFLLMGGLVAAVSQLVPYVILGAPAGTGILNVINSGEYTGFAESLLRFGYICNRFGWTLFGFAIPMFAAFTAGSIGGKLAFPAGFIGGVMANNPHEMLKLVDGTWEPTTRIASGFLGAILIAFLAGYFVKWLNQKIKVSHDWLAFKTTLLIPLTSAFFVMIFMHFAITPMGGWLNEMIRTVLAAAGEAGEIGYALALSASTAIDLGGPINKAAGFVALGFATDEILPITARAIAIVVPSFGLGLATIIDKKLVGKKVFDKQFYVQGKSAIFLAFMGISEGALPFLLEKPKITLPAYMIGAMTGGTLAVMFGAQQWFPESAIWAWPLVQNLPMYILGILVGSIVTALIVVYARYSLIKKGELVVDGDE